MKDIFYARPVIPLLLSMMSGIALGSWFPGHRIPAGIVVLWCIAVICRVLIGRKTAVTSPLALFAALGYLSIQSWVAPEFPPDHVVHFLDTHPWEVTGVLDAPPSDELDRQKIILRVETLGDQTRSFPVCGKIRVTVTGDSRRLCRGDRVAFSARIKSIRNFSNPGGFDYRRYMAFKGVWGTAYVSGERIAVLGKTSGRAVAKTIDRARGRVSDFIETSTRGRVQGVLKALIIGNRNAVPAGLREAFNRAGIGHLLAISGLHIGIVATAAFVLFRWMLSRIDLFLWEAWAQKGAAILSAIPVLIYGLLSGMSPSTQRALIMVAVFLSTFLAEREQDLMNTLALAAMLILAVHPPSLFSISFQLSFGAVLAILYGLSQLQNQWFSGVTEAAQQQRHLFLKKLIYFFMASVFAIFGTLPLVMMYFNQISVVGILTNVVLVPLIGFIVVPLGLLSVFLYPLTNVLASACLKAAAAVLMPALVAADFFAGLPFAAVKTVTPTYFETVCYYLLFWAVLNLLNVRPETAENDSGVQTATRAPNGLKPGSTRTVFRQRPAAVVAVIVILALGLDALYWLNQRFWQDDLRVTVIDVGQGVSALLELPGGRCILIDGGGFSDNRIFDAGARIVAPLLWRKKIKTVDTLVLSHPNTDHLNGLLYIARHFNVQRIWTNGDAANTLSYRHFLDTIAATRVFVPEYDEIHRTQRMDGLLLKILYPPKDFIERRTNEPWRGTNNSSLVVKVEFGSKSFLFPGDIKARAEKELIETAGDGLRSTVLISPHHGSNSSSTASFLDNVKPEIVIVSSGWNNRFGFPHPQVLKRYRDRGCRIFRTDSHGAVTLSTDGDRLTITPTL
ncbi:MAG: DNA internalization-related competence protein ComEC/Rec2 [Pseudomonadota bacterium]